MALGARGWILLGAAIVALAAAPASASALSEVMAVNTTEDRSLTEHSEYCSEEGALGGICPLRAALESAREIVIGGAENIIISVPEGHYVLSKGAMPLGSANPKACSVGACPVTLIGAGAGRTIIDGNKASGLLTTVSKAAALTIEKVTLMHGTDQFGGAVLVPGGEAPPASLTVRESVLAENHATERGGGMYFSGSTLSIVNSTIEGNFAGSGGGVEAFLPHQVSLRGSTVSGNQAVGPGGGLALNTSGGLGTTITDSTIANNGSGAKGGGIFAIGSDPLTIRYSTIAGNTSAEDAGGIDGSGETPLTIEGAILSGNRPPECRGVAPAPTALGANLVFGSSSCAFTGAPPITTDPKLGMLSANGGFGETLPLLRGSSALNAGGASCPNSDLGAGPIDERGVRRPQGAGCDLGAFESAADAAVTLSAAPEPVTVGTTLTLTANVSDAGSDPLSGVTLTVPVPAGSSFVSAPAGCTATFASTTTVTCQLGSLVPGQVKPVAIGVRPERVGALLESASVVIDQADSNPANDSMTIASVVTTALGGGGQSGGLSGGPSGANGSGSEREPSSSVIGSTASLDSHGTVTLRASCGASTPAGCSDVLALYASAGTLPASVSTRTPPKATQLGLVRVHLPAGRTTIVRLRLNSAGRKLAGAHRSFSARLLLSLHGPHGIVLTHRYTVTVKRAATTHRH